MRVTLVATVGFCVWLVVSICAPELPLKAGNDSQPAANAPIVAPDDATPVAIPAVISDYARQARLDMTGTSAWHDSRNILELSMYGKRRGVPVNKGVTVLIEYGVKRFWLVDRFPAPAKITVVGPFSGDAISTLKVGQAIRQGLVHGNYSTYIQTISTLLLCDDSRLVRLGLECVPPAVGGEVENVGTFLHFIEHALPRRRAAFVHMGFKKETDTALASMQQARVRIAAVTREQEPPQYSPGYDPAITQRNQIRGLPDAAWGQAVNGLQAGVSAPEKIRLNEVVTFYLVVRNISQKTIRVSLPERPILVNVQPDGSSISYSMARAGGRLRAWELQPGQQTNIPSPPFQALVPGDVGIKYALTRLQPGMHWLNVRTGAGGDRWVTDADGKRRRVVPSKDEWTGWLKAAKRSVEITAEKAPFTIGPLKELPPGHGLEHVVGTPASLNRSRTQWIERPEEQSEPLDALSIALNGERDEHWLIESETYNRPIYWGPVSAKRLKDLKLIEAVRQRSREHIENATYAYDAEDRIEALVRCAEPLPAVGLQLVSELKVPESEGRIPSDDLVRTIRDRRVELEAMGLAAPLQEALTILTANDPPLPDDSQFRVISHLDLPAGLSKDAWGPVNAGLRAAALMPEVIPAGATVNSRLFVRNVSDQDVRLTVSERAGYDYATAVDTQGNKLQSIRPWVYPTFFGSGIGPELNPGQSTRSPPVATLSLVLLKPGAVLELTTKTALSFHAPDSPAVSLSPVDDKQAVTQIKSKPTTALITWHLHAANGAIHSKDLKRRLWPAKGGWSGILTTAPVAVKLGP